MAQQTRLGMYGGARSPYGSFAGKSEPVLVVSGALDFTATEQRMQFTAPKQRMQFTSEEERMQFTSELTNG